MVCEIQEQANSDAPISVDNRKSALSATSFNIGIGNKFADNFDRP